MPTFHFGSHKKEQLNSTGIGEGTDRERERGEEEVEMARDGAMAAIVGNYLSCVCHVHRPNFMLDARKYVNQQN